MVRNAVRSRLELVAISLAFILALHSVSPALAQSQAAQSQPDNALSSDLFEPANRLFNSLNSYLVTNLLEPTGRIYVDNLKPETRRGITNAFVNLREPITILSDILVLDGAGATNAAARFSINSTLGVLGFYDVATGYGYPLKPRRLNQVLCRVYFPEGPYFVLPFFGPANLRDTAAVLATNFLQYAVAGSAYIPYRLLEAIAIYAPGSGKPETRVIDYGAVRESYIERTRAACEAERNAI